MEHLRPKRNERRTGGHPRRQVIDSGSGAVEEGNAPPARQRKR